MGDKQSKEEKQRSREAARAERRQKSLERHTVPCPHCGKGILDHMTTCPFCGKDVHAQGYNPVDKKKFKRIKLVTGIVFFAIALGVALAIILTR